VLEEHKYDESIKKKLTSLVHLEEAAVLSVRQRMVSYVQDDVKNLFLKDKKAKEIALEQALAVLSSGEAAKLGRDPVGEAFGMSFKAYREKYIKLKPEDDEILVKLKQDIEAVIKPPSVSAKGSNVYESHNIGL
jgi:hypothetical protein